ncbi:hypothetical protein HanIR_Chr05g0237471 [Helianthus annuus]|nr:hypothetical protein HanIR_Chr05g0237471 [Helianthus annuus]
MLQLHSVLLFQRLKFENNLAIRNYQQCQNSKITPIKKENYRLKLKRSRIKRRTKM